MPRVKKAAPPATPAPPPRENINPELAALARDVADLHLDNENARDHSERDIRAIADSLSTFGQQKAIVVSPNGRVIAGNGTLQAARLLGWRHIAAVTFVGDPKHVRAFALADNRTAELSGWNYERVTTQLQEIAAWEDDIIGKLGWDELELRPLLAASWQPPPLVDEPIEIKRRDKKDDTPAAPEGGMLVAFSAEQWAEIERAIERYVQTHPGETLETFEVAITAVCRAACPS